MGDLWKIAGPMMNRRHAALLALSGMTGISGCRGRGSDQDEPEVVAEPEAPPRLPLEGEGLVPVRVDESLVIRSVVGLRPFRASGFVVRREERDGKILVHNYGHGGGGITLSWGSAHLALREAGSVAGVACAVIGGGVMGLSTARMLQLRGARVTLYTRELPPDTTSNIAGGHWWPVSVFDRNRLTDAFTAQFVEAAEFSFRYFQRLVGPRWGIRWVPSYYLSSGPPSNSWMAGPGGVLHHTQIGFQDFAPGEHALPQAWARRFQTMLIEPSIYLQTLLGEVQSAGGEVVVRDFQSADEIGELDQQVLFNCTGLGARALFDDRELIAARGQLEILLPQSRVNYNLITGSNYMFSRADGVVLGGTFERNNWSLEPDPATTRRILAGNRAAFEEMARLSG